MNTHRKMYFRMIWKAFINRISRVLISSLAIMVGACTLSCLSLIAVTVPEQMKQELRSFGANLIVLPDKTEFVQDAELAQIDEVAEGHVLGKAGYYYTNLLYKQQPVPVMATDIDQAYKIRQFWKIDGELADNDSEVMIGKELSERYRLNVGDRIELTAPDSNDVATFLTISAVVRSGSSEEGYLIMNDSTLAQFTDAAQGRYNVIEYSLSGNTEQLETLSDKMNSTSDTLKAEVVRRVVESEAGIAETLRTLIWIVAIIICIITLITVSATINAVVTERAKEIGLKKALGALPKDIVGELVGEAVLTGALGGLVGVFAGGWCAKWVTNVAFTMDLSINPVIVPIVAALSILLAIVASWSPARKISRIQPIEVLGGE